MTIRLIATLLLPALLLAACNATPSPGPNGVGAPTFSGDRDNGDPDD